ncbi:hypothetical protein ACCO45_001315 [Purpureocillium lilacinum]|uniref:Uncharacterized protein n=1 Tax=Purpureocillium lilacinum TaxID=33203 RepID=A0ACC4E781_PURLI
MGGFAAARAAESATRRGINPNQARRGHRLAGKLVLVPDLPLISAPVRACLFPAQMAACLPPLCSWIRAPPPDLHRPPPLRRYGFSSSHCRVQPITADRRQQYLDGQLETPRKNGGAAVSQASPNDTGTARRSSMSRLPLRGALTSG